MNYGDLIRDAFRITLRNRYLWFFGFFVGGTGSNFGGNIGNFNPSNFTLMTSSVQAPVSPDSPPRSGRGCWATRS
jgi:hypothetical protein